MKHKLLCWLSAIFLALPLAALDGAPRDDRRKLVDHWAQCIETLEAMRAVQTAVEAYAVDHPAYPAAATMEELRALVQPTYIGATPMTDAWGTPLRYVVSADGKRYVLVSAGSDRRFDQATWATPVFLSESARDAVLTSEGWASYREWVIQE
jgi:hypothetical protein